ncbi:polysaccharide lyase family 7 protein [Candidatus Roizmanbacteria bacterium]|nr:polysaccharide lyase family 7 protein [Candidatus Roizmanbacteria bacterium]
MNLLKKTNLYLIITVLVFLFVLKTFIFDLSAYPSQVIDLTNWKLTLPMGSAENPKEIKQPELAKYRINLWFIVSKGDGVRFRAPVNGVTTSGSKYPRTELREMSNNGSENAAWSSAKGIHTMFLDQAITAVPQSKKHVVAGQIHDAEEDIIVIRLDYPNLYIKVGEKNKYKLDSDYKLGKRFSVKFDVSEGKTRIYYNDISEPVYILKKKYSRAYFKAGIYVQSNCETESSVRLCNDKNYGEVIIYQLIVTHQ